ncbi:MAG TPA: polysaccharide pyruvyl transferase family protein, partial [Chroococcales cyanobacterium]
MSDKQPVRVTLLGVNFESGNMGVRALAVGAIECILARYPGAQVSVLDYAREGSVHILRLRGREIPIPLVNMRFSRRFCLSNNIALLLLMAGLTRLIPFRSLRTRLLDNNVCLSHLLHADMVLSLAGGDSFSDIYGMARLLYVALPQILALWMGKPLVLLPQTYGPFRGKLAKKIARYIVMRAEEVYARDRHSLNVLQDLNSGRHMAGKFSYDLGFTVEPTEPPHPDVIGIDWNERGVSNLAGLNISGLLTMGGYTGKDMFGLGIDYKHLVCSLIDILVTRRSARVLLVPHVFCTAEDPESDVFACEQIYEALRERYPGQLGLLRGNYDQSEIKYVIGQCDFFVGSRMHACIAAISQGIPAVAV